MKKFLSLLLALTLVLSLVVVPARAADGDEATIAATTASIARGANTSIATVAGNDNVATVTGGSTVYSLSSDVKTVTFNGRPYTNTKSGCTVYYLLSEETKLGTKDGNWSISPSTVTLTRVAYNKDSHKATLSLSKQGEGNQQLTDSLEVTCIQATVPNEAITVTTTHDSDGKYRAGSELTLTVPDSSNKNSQNVRYVWSATKNGTPLPSVAVSSANKWTPSEAGNYVLTRTVYEGTVEEANKVGVQTSNTIKVKEDNYKTTVTAPRTSLSVAANSTAIPYSFIFKDYSSSAAGVIVPLDSTNVTWSVSGGNAKFQNKSTTYTAVGTALGTADALLTPGTTAATNITVTATFTYGNKTYTVSFPNLSIISLTAKLNATYYGAGSTYTSSSLVSYADSAIKSYSYAQLVSGEYVSSVLIDTIGMNSNGLGQFANVSSASITFTPYVNSFGKATFTGTAVTNKNNRFTITFSIPVTPVPVNSFDSQTAEPISTSSVNTSYKVSAPSGYTKFYVLGNSSNQTIDYSQYSAAQLNSMGYTYTTIPSTYFSTSGQCTLYVIAWNDSASYTNYSKYYCGPMTVTQTNYNINYNGVAGETVQFKHTDFTNFMNEVAQARGDSSKTGSYPYVTFSYVTFDYPSTAQGTLYYNGTAMSTSSYSGAFNSRTQITNLDNITFVPYAKTNAKTVAVTFTLHAVKYGTNGTVVNRDVQYRGTVNISLVREDVTFTVAPGDSVTFTDSDFLNYLRAQSGINYNYNIDYVTFDQSAVDTINGGVLYSGYAGYNQVKPTDKFYYTTTNNYTQNALSDVTFRASLYAKTGTTVYIPFTIYARYGTSSAATRQVTGTVAVKIAQTMNFVDVKPTDYFYNPVKWAVGKNITKGTSAVTFSPDRTCTRAEIVTFLWRDAGSPMPTITRNPFSDVNYSMGADFYNAILWASQNGITAGTDVSHFSPNKTCTRAEIVTFLWRYAKKPVGYGSNSFTDVNKTEHAPYYDAILWAVSKGITNGSTTTTFAPDGTCTRGQAVTFLYRYEGGK